jgi:hypothetical protein
MELAFHNTRRLSAISKRTALWLVLAIVSALDLTARAGLIAGSVTLTTDPGTTNLTTVGTDDWAVWGGTSNETQGSTTPYDEKNVATHDIQGMTLLGGLTVSGLTNRTNQPGDYTWSDGTNMTDQSSALPLFMQAYPVNGSPTDGPAIGTGFQLTFAASNALSRTLTLTLGYVNVATSLTASLSDSSASPYTDAETTSNNGANFLIYTITYVANSPDQTLTVDYTTTADNGQFDNIAVESASLSAVAVVPEPISLSIVLTVALGLLMIRPRNRHRCL